MSLEDRLESGLPSAWRPDQEDPDLLVGTVADIDFGVSEYTDSGKYPIIVIVDEKTNEEKAVHAFHSVLANELKRQKPQIGERIGIKFLGEQPTKPGSKFKSYIGYRVKVERETSTFDWDKIDAAPDPEPAAATPQEPVTVPAGAGDDDIPFGPVAW
jgi:hypothetical protein